MRDNFPYPVPPEVLEAFRHVKAGHDFEFPRRVGLEVVAANGYAAIRCQRGRWLDAEYEEAGGPFLYRLGGIPWDRFGRLEDWRWKSLDGIRAAMFAHGVHGFWIEGKERVNPCPVWRVGDVVVRLSLLQLVGRLPRAEVAWTGDSDSPLWFRFSGGRGAIAPDKRLRTWGFAVLQPGINPLTRERDRDGPKRVFQGLAPSGTMKNWPPVEPVD